MSKQEFHVSRRFAAEGSKIIMVDIDETISRYASGCKRTYDMACYYDFTMNQLQKWGVKFNELSTGTRGNYLKPPVDIVIDDKAVTMDSLIVAKKVLK